MATLHLKLNRSIQKGTIGTIIIGIILLISGITYLNDVVNSVGPTDWDGLRSRKLLEYEVNTQRLGRTLDKDYFKGRISKDQWLNQNEILKENIELGRDEIYLTIERLKNFEAVFFLMSHPVRLYIYLILSMWLIVAGIGFTIVFPWVKWFVYLSICISFFWQTYVYVYREKVEGLLAQSQININDLLGLAAKVSHGYHPNLSTQLEMLHTFIFLGMLYYFSSETGQSLFRHSKRNFLDDFLSNEPNP